MPAAVKVHQIYYDAASRARLDPGFIPLDNSANQRPDWYEYWPIRNWMLANTMDEAAFYGFFSPRFKDKTDLTAAQVHAFVEKHADTCDVAIFTPPHEFHALFWNVFEQGNHHHPGFNDASQQFLDTIGFGLKLPNLCNDSRSAVYANYFVARPAFWRRWFAVTEQLFALAEDKTAPIRPALVRETHHRPGNPIVQYKVFVMERIAALLLGSDPSIRTVTHPSEIILGANPVEAIACDALKTAYLIQGHQPFKTAFFHLRNMVISRLKA